MGIKKIEDAADPNRDPDHPLAPLIGTGVLLAVLLLVLDLFDVSFFDGVGPGACVTMLGLGTFALVLEGLHTGRLPILFGFIVRKVFPLVFWASMAIYALAGITMIVVGGLMIFGIVEG